MVTALQGVLISCDIPLKEILKALNSQDPDNAFIISDLKEGSLFIRADKLEYVQQKVKDHLNALHYEHKKE